MASKSTLSDYLAELGVDINNMQEFLNKLTQMLVTNSDTVSINQKLQDGSTKAFNVPSFAYLSNKIEAIDTKFNSLLTGNANQVGVVDENGQVRRFELQDISQIAQDLDAIAGRTLNAPVNFNYKTNWFFESFLNPLIYINLPVGSITSSEIDKFEVKRVIMTSQAIEDTAYFDATYKGQNNIVYSTLVEDLAVRGINHFEDTNEAFLPPGQNKYFGSFNILNILSDVQAEVVGGQSLTFTVNKYVLNTLRYAEKDPVNPNRIIQRTLKVGDYLISADNSEYQVTAVNVSQKSISVTRVFGVGELRVGANQLTIKPELRQSTNLSINIGYNERQVIFLRPISTRLRVSTESFSLGVGFYTNELTISLGNGRSMTFNDFYNQFVSDFGLLFLSYAKERKLPSSLGDIPNSPQLEVESFKVVQTDQHIREADDILQVKQNISSVEQVKSQIKEVDRQISDKRSELNINAALSEAQRIKLSKDLTTLSDSRKTLTTQQSSKLASITTAVRAVPTLAANPTYSIKGFWQIPEAKITEHGPQNVVQFKIAYRVLSKTGTSESVEQIAFTDPAGNKVVGAFSPWKEIMSKPRTKKINPQTGFYEWEPEKIADPDSVNMNQVEIPISKGQVVEIRVKSLSEAGYPDNAVESDWSNSIQIGFPANLQSVEDISIISQQAFAEEVKVNFQDELNSKGLDLHLGTSFTTRDKYFAHQAEDIASGFRTSNSEIIDLYTKLKSISDDITSIQTALSSGQGELKVSILDQAGNQTEVSNGQTVSLFAGYYKDDIKNAAGKTTQYEHGKIMTKQYQIQIENTSQTPLELISAIAGGTFEKATDSTDSLVDIYNSSLRYDKAPIVIANPTEGKINQFRQADGLQSSQVKGQILYARAKSVDLSQSLYAAEPSEADDNLTDLLDNYTTGTDFNYRTGFLANTKAGATTTDFAYTIPYNAGHYLPYDPTLQNLTVLVNGKAYTLQKNASVWNGLLSSNRAPLSGGLLSEFCISVDHPDIKRQGRYNSTWNNSLYRPAPVLPEATSGISRVLSGYTVDAATLKKLPFSQAAHFETSQAESINPLGARNFQQAAYRLPTDPNPPADAAITSFIMKESDYPIKCSFEPNDKYLIGKYTCGAYMYIAPKSYQDIGATSISPNGVKRIVQVGANNAIKIPLIFQYRCSDYLKYVGGFRVDNPSGLKNVGYLKKMGFDIGLKTETFSFDIEISAQYDKETALVSPTTGVTQTATDIS
jgi:hypothetical protein